MVDSRPRDPARTGYLLAAVVVVVGLVGAVVWGVLNFGVWSDIDDFPRAEIPGELTVDIDEPGRQVVYYERRGWFATVPVVVDLDVRVTDPAGAAVPVTPRSGAENYQQLRLFGQSLAEFEVTTTGPHTVTVDGVPPHDDTTFAVGESVAGTLLRDMAGPVLLLLASLVVAVVVVVVVRRRST